MSVARMMNNFENILSLFKNKAWHKSAVIIVDDDFILRYRAGMGCACPFHINRICE